MPTLEDTKPGSRILVFFSSRRRHTRFDCDWSSDVCSSDLNITPDSFFDGGKFYAEEQAMEHAVEMERAGADLIDVGAESTRPGSQKISGEAELRRGLPPLGGPRPAVTISLFIAPPKGGGA